MSYQPIYDGEFDVIAEDRVDLELLLEAVFRHKLMMIGWVTVGPGGGNPMITLRGTKRQFMGWVRDYYNDDLVTEDQTDEELWAAIAVQNSLKLVA